MRGWTIVVGVILFVSMLVAKTTVPNIGESLYLRGVTPSGAALKGVREAGGSASGDAVACVNCHRRSGLGTVEGRIVIPPVTAKYLFHPTLRSVQEPESHHVGVSPRERSAYTDETLARAIREGIDPDGKPLDYLMPRYQLNDAATASLIDYLKSLSSGEVPGVTDDTLHFATIITPDADPAKRKGVLDVLERFFESKNGFYRADTPTLVSSRRMKFRVLRKWQLHVWELTGGPETWEEQLRSRLKAEPVFAVISGLGGRTWQPVHRFCEEESLPCILPNVDLPVDAESDFYNVYFSKGVLLEAQLMARQIEQTAGTSKLRRVIQVYRQEDVGADAARALHDEIAPHGLAVKECALAPGDAAGEIAAAVENAGPQDALILWLRPGDLRSLPANAPGSSSIFVSGIMGDLEDSPLNEAWRGAVQMTYPYELPAPRSARLNYILGWFRIEHIPVVAVRTQVDTYIACGILAENLSHMLDNFVRDYLLETVEVMLSSRIINGYYPRLGLAPGQRFASKGGYIIHFAGADEKKMIPEGGWIVP
jgi:hypothetical protein